VILAVFANDICESLRAQSKRKNPSAETKRKRGVSGEIYSPEKSLGRPLPLEEFGDFSPRIKCGVLGKLPQKQKAEWRGERSSCFLLFKDFISLWRFVGENF